MAKKKNNRFIPPKGKPSGSGKEAPGLKDFMITNLETDNELAEQYTEGEYWPEENIHLRLAKRNADKGEDDQANEWLQNKSLHI